MEYVNFSTPPYRTSSLLVLRSTVPVTHMGDEAILGSLT
mgnify:CR=1 FL=1